jgi:hypothetical protein
MMKAIVSLAFSYPSGEVPLAAFTASEQAPISGIVAPNAIPVITAMSINSVITLISVIKAISSQGIQ